MSKTYRREPFTASGLRKPQTRNERRQLRCLKTDALLNDLEISPRNRINKHIPSEYNDLYASSIDENYHNS